MLLPDWQIVERGSGRVIVAQLELADRPWSRLLGWQWRRPLDERCGLLIVPCRSVHTCFVRFALDLVGLDASGRIASLELGLRPWRAAWCPRSVQAVLELPSPAGRSLAVGNRLQAVALNPALPLIARASLRFLTS
ncbi:MAG TPA: DUF192 domain-containing protein [Pirellulales bacterium]|jgi:hypothetical protein|nr:DUF192 domain-containing protein [Pirellulales bacterium]